MQNYATQLVSEHRRGARLIGTRATWQAQRSARLWFVVIAAIAKEEKTKKKAALAWPWPVFRLKWAKFRFAFRSKKAQISLLISFYVKKNRTFRI